MTSTPQPPPAADQDQGDQKRRNPRYEELLERNKRWAAQQPRLFFDKLRGVQQPDFLWIGCSDSRILSSTITGSTAGQIFVHRNIANLVVPTDFNLLCVLDYGVNYLGVKHIIVCGHYGCGGVHAAMGRKDYANLLNGWLLHIKRIYELNKTELDAIPCLEARENRLAELNVLQQVRNLAQTSCIQRVWRASQTRPWLHGWMYGIGDGLIKPLTNVKPNSKLSPIFEYHL